MKKLTLILLCTFLLTSCDISQDVSKINEKDKESQTSFSETIITTTEETTSQTTTSTTIPIEVTSDDSLKTTTTPKEIEETKITIDKSEKNARAARAKYQPTKTQLNLDYLLEKNRLMFFTFINGGPVLEEYNITKPQIVVGSKYFKNFADLKDCIYEIYTKEYADELMYNTFERGKPGFFEEDGIWYMDTQVLPASWTLCPFWNDDYFIEIIDENQEICNFNFWYIYPHSLTDPEDYEWMCESETAVKEDGEWKFTEMIY